MFRRFGMKFQQFMLGRRGIDTLGIALLAGYLVFNLLSSFFYGNWILYSVLSLVALVCLVFFLLRFFSRNLGKREAENRKFQKFWNSTRARFRDRKTHVFFKCPACKNTLRVPKGRGNVTVTCPVCREQIRKKT